MVTTEDKPLKQPVLFLREWREHRGMPGTVLANRLNTTRQTVFRWEQGTVSLTVDQLTSYADALGVQPIDLFRSPHESVSERHGHIELQRSELQHELEEVKAERDRLEERVSILTKAVMALGKVK